MKVRRITKDGSKYFGPYTNVFAFEYYFGSVAEIYPIRTCKRDIAKSIEKQERPCLNYYIHRCVGPCTGKSSQRRIPKDD